MKYMIMYALNLKAAPGSEDARTEMVQCASLFAVVMHVLRNKAAREALAVGRFQFIKVVRS